MKLFDPTQQYKRHVLLLALFVNFVVHSTINWLDGALRRGQRCRRDVGDDVDEQTSATAHRSTLVVGGGVLCFFSFANETKNTTNSEQLQITLVVTGNQRQHRRQQQQQQQQQ
jgi:hypothetical protein